MPFPKDFFCLNLLFARKVSEASGQPFEPALLDYTQLYLSFGLSRSFDPSDPIWQAYLEGLQKEEEPCAWTYVFYQDRMAHLPPKAPPVPSFGCFSFALWPGDRVRLHFRNTESPPYSPLSRERQSIRRAELKEMFAHIQQHVEHPRTVVGGSWLYHLDSYRRLFPPSFLETACPGDEDFQFIALWGQFLDRFRCIRQELAGQFRENLAGSHTMDRVKASFPYPVLRLESPIQDFYRFYQLG